MDKDKALQYNERRGEVEHARLREGKTIGGKFSGTKSKRTARKLERERILSDPKLIAEKIAEIRASTSPNQIPTWLKVATNEDHAMDKPKPLEEVSDGDLSEIKKDPVWKTWLEKVEDLDQLNEIHDKEDEDEEDEATEVKKGVKDGQYTGPSHADVPDAKENHQGYTALMHPKDVLARMANANYKRDRVGNTGTGKQFENFPSSREERDSRQSNIRNRDTSVPRASLWVDSKTGQVRAHESRHQTRAMLDEGVTSTPVDIIPDESGTNVKHIKPEDIKGEKLSEHWYKNTEEGNKEGNEQFKRRKAGKKRRREEQRENIKRKKIKEGMQALKAWEVWLDNITKPIPDSKGGRGSFQHCINANQDKHNPGGWCKQIERKIGKGRDEGEEEEVKISTYDKLRRIKDRLQTHNKAKKQTRIDRQGEWFDPSKIGTKTGWDDDPMNKPSYFFAVMREEEERKKKEKKKARSKRPPLKGNSAYQKGKLENQDRKGQRLGGKETGEEWKKYWDEHKRIRDEKEAQDEVVEAHVAAQVNKEVEEPESDYYMDAGGNPQRKEKADYFVEEIRSNIIYHNKIFPLLGMIAGQVARGVGQAGMRAGKKLLGDVGEVSQEMLAEEEEEQ